MYRSIISCPGWGGGDSRKNRDSDYIVNNPLLYPSTYLAKSSLLFTVRVTIRVM